MQLTTLADAKKNFTRREFQVIHERAMEAVRSLKRKEAELIEALQAVDKARVYRYLGYGSLYSYGVQALGLSEHQAYAYISVARKARELPFLQKAIETGEITVNKAKRLTAVINETNQRQWIELASQSTHRELEKEIAKENPRAARPEGARYVNDWLLELQTPISEENYKQLQRVQELLRQETKGPVSVEDALKCLCDFYLARRDPVRKAERTLQRIEKKPKAIKLKNVQRKRSHIPAAISAKVIARDQGQCTALDTQGKRCPSKVFLEFHHVIPVSQGGADTVENLKTLCFPHHRNWHEEK